MLIAHGYCSNLSKPARFKALSMAIISPNSLHIGFPEKFFRTITMVSCLCSMIPPREIVRSGICTGAIKRKN
jgi:hypothetical protein